MGARLLIIEDNPANLALMSYLLHAYGHEVRSAMDGESGLEEVRRNAPELVICDLQLPRLDGYGVLARLRQHPVFGAIPVVAVTAFAMVGDRDRVLAAGFDGYIAKPISPETFVRQVEAFLPRQSEAAPGSVLTASAADSVPVAPAAGPAGAHPGLPRGAPGRDAVRSRPETAGESWRAEEKFRSFVEAAPDAIVIVDATGRIVLVNAQFETFFGYPREEVLGRPVEVVAAALRRRDHLRQQPRPGHHLHPVAAGAGGAVTAARLRVLLVEDDPADARRLRQALARSAGGEVDLRHVAGLSAARARLRTLSGLLPICASCKRVRDDRGYWSQIEAYLRAHAGVEFSHGLCPACAETLYEGIALWSTGEA